MKFEIHANLFDIKSIIDKNRYLFRIILRNDYKLNESSYLLDLFFSLLEKKKHDFDFIYDSRSKYCSTGVQVIP